MKKLFVATAMAMAVLSAQATSFTVDARSNSSTGGIGLDTIALATGQSFAVLASATDLWSSGPLPRYSNANGLISDLTATGADESGLVAGTVIGQNWGSHTQNGFTAAYGQLVGLVGSQYFALDTSSGGTAASAGTLKLFYWDSNAGDNTGSIAVNVSAVPEPETFAMLLAGLGLIGLVKRRKLAKDLA